MASFESNAKYRMTTTGQSLAQSLLLLINEGKISKKEAAAILSSFDTSVHSCINRNVEKNLSNVSIEGNLAFYNCTDGLWKIHVVDACIDTDGSSTKVDSLYFLGQSNPQKPKLTLWFFIFEFVHRRKIDVLFGGTRVLILSLLFNIKWDFLIDSHFNAFAQQFSRKGQTHNEREADEIQYFPAKIMIKTWIPKPNSTLDAHFKHECLQFQVNLLLPLRNRFISFWR